MSQPGSPWGAPPPPPRPGSGKAVRWLVPIGVAGLGLWGLTSLAPDVWDDPESLVRIVVFLALLLLVGRGLLSLRGAALRRSFRDALAWVAIAVGIGLGYLLYDDARLIGARFLAALLPGHGIEAGDETTVLHAGRDGHFRLTARINGTSVALLLDTGASDIVLGPADARRIGLDLDQLRFTREYETANGIARAAPVRLTSFQIGPLTRYDIRAAVIHSDLRDSLLGMSLLRTLAGVEIRGDTLRIRWR